MVKDNKTCILCGKKYSYCNRCEEFDHLPRWMEIYCSENCKKIFNALSSYNMGHITKEEAKTRLEECDLSYIDKFNHINKKFVEDIIDTKIQKSDNEIKPIINTVNVINDDPMVDKSIVEKESTEVIAEPQDKPKHMRNVKRK